MYDLFLSSNKSVPTLVHRVAGISCAIDIHLLVDFGTLDMYQNYLQYLPVQH